MIKLMSGIPIWYFAILLYFAASTANSLLQRRLALKNKLPPRLVSALLFSTVLYPVALCLAFIRGNIWIDWHLTSASILLAAGLLVGGFNAIALQLNKKVDATQYVILMNLYTPITVCIGAFVLHEAFTGVQFFGMLLLLIGAILVATRGFSRKTWQFDKHSILLALASVALGIGLAAEKASLSYMSPSAYMIFGWGIQIIFMVLLAYKDWHVIPAINKTEWLDIFKVGLARAGHVIGFFLSVALSRNVALIASLSSFRVPLVFIASFLILKERDHLSRKMIGVIIATIGLLLL
jgi:drug/metabolite transporter (DMT)-like permease